MGFFFVFEFCEYFLLQCSILQTVKYSSTLARGIQNILQGQKSKKIIISEDMASSRLALSTRCSSQCDKSKLFVREPYNKNYEMGLLLLFSQEREVLKLGYQNKVCFCLLILTCFKMFDVQTPLN